MTITSTISWFAFEHLMLRDDSVGVHFISVLHFWRPTGTLGPNTPYDPTIDSTVLRKKLS
jgi:hypothetical protein